MSMMSCRDSFTVARKPEAQAKANPRTSLACASGFGAAFGATAILASLVAGFVGAATVAGGGIDAQDRPAVATGGFANAATGDWPGWRGVNASGLSEETGFPTEWNESTNVVWKTEVAGSGHSSPVVWEDRIFLTTSEEGGKPRGVLCFHRSSGKQLWRTDCPSDTTEETHRKNGYASSTPATDGERVYAFFGSAGAMAVDFDGKLAWHRDLGQFTSEYGVAGSPMLFEGTVILNCDQGTTAGPAGSFLIALDKKNGETVWRTERPEQSHSWSSPVLVPVEGSDRLELVLNGGKRVWAYDPRTGEPLWNCGGTEIEVTPTAVIGNGLVYIVSGVLKGGLAMALRPGGRGDVSKSHVAWQAKKGGAYVPSPVFCNGRLYVVNDGGIMTCFDGASGKVVAALRRVDAPEVPIALLVFRIFTDADVDQPVVVDWRGNERISRRPFQSVERLFRIAVEFPEQLGVAVGAFRVEAVQPAVAASEQHLLDAARHGVGRREE
jgi:hypothetical protein